MTPKEIIRNVNFKTFNEDKVFDNISIYEDNFTLESLGSVEEVKGDLFLNCFKLKDLGNLKTVKKSCNIRNSLLDRIENLSVGENLNISNNEIKLLVNVNVQGTLILSSHLKGHVQLINCNITKTIHRKSMNRNSRKKIFYNFSISNFRVYTDIDLTNKTYSFEFLILDSGKNFIENDKHYKSLKTKIYRDKLKVSDYNIDKNIEKFYELLLFEICFDFDNKIISEIEFIDKSFSIILKFNKVFMDNIQYKEYHKLSLDFYRDFYRLKNRYDLVYELVKLDLINIDFSIIHDIEFNLKRKVVDSKILFNNFGLKSELNQFIQDNLDEYFDFIDEKILKIYDGKESYFSSLFYVNKSISLINSEFPNGENSRSYIQSKLKKEPCLSYLKVRESFPKEHKFMWGGKGNFELKLKTLSFNSFLEILILEIFSSIIIGYQNEYRKIRGIPNIGEGWVSETNLYYQLKSVFNETDVIHHGKPKWLGKQHVDIWLPKHNIGIEYQGKQHDEPVEFFGGEESFIKNKERDKRKKKLFKENNSDLIEVREGYDIEEVIIKVEDLINKRVKNTKVTLLKKY